MQANKIFQKYCKGFKNSSILIETIINIRPLSMFLRPNKFLMFGCVPRSKENKLFALLEMEGLICIKHVTFKARTVIIRSQYWQQDVLIHIWCRQRWNIFTMFKRFLSSQQFPQQNAETVNIIFDSSWCVYIFKHFWRHVNNCSTSCSSGRLCCSFLFPLCQPKVTYLMYITAKRIQWIGLDWAGFNVSTNTV